MPDEEPPEGALLQQLAVDRAAAGLGELYFVAVTEFNEEPPLAGRSEGSSFWV